MNSNLSNREEIVTKALNDLQSNVNHTIDAMRKIFGLPYRSGFGVPLVSRTSMFEDDDVIIYGEDRENDKPFDGGIVYSGRDVLPPRKLVRTDATVSQTNPVEPTNPKSSVVEKGSERFPINVDDDHDENVQFSEDDSNYSDDLIDPEEIDDLDDELKRRASKTLPAKRVRKRVTIFDPSYNREADQAALRCVDTLGRDDTVLSNNDGDDLEAALNQLDGTDGSLGRFLRTGWGRACLGDILEVCANNSGLQSESNHGPAIIRRYIQGVCENTGTGMVWMSPRSGTCCLCNRRREVSALISMDLEDDDEDYYAGRFCGQMLSSLGKLTKMLCDGIPRGMDAEDFWDSVLNAQAVVQSSQKSKTVVRNKKGLDNTKSSTKLTKRIKVSTFTAKKTNNVDNAKSVNKRVKR